MLGRPPCRIDLISKIDGISFEEANSNKVKGKLDQMPVFFISIEDLIKNKIASGRDKDLLDVKNLKRILQKKQ